MAGLSLLVNGVVNLRRELAALFAGHPEQAHRAGSAWAHAHFATPLPAAVDVAVFNAYPKDTDLLQASNAVNVAGKRIEEVVRPGGTIVIMVACPEGLGWHALGSPGMAAPFVYDIERDFGGRHLIIFSPNLCEPEVRTVYPHGAYLACDWESALAELQRQHGPATRVAVFPSGTLQVGA